MTLESWHALRDLFQRWTGMVLPETMRLAAVDLLQRMAAEAGRDPLMYLRILDRDQSARQVLLDQLGLGTTWFMRDAAGLRALVSTLAAQASERQPVHIWSAGCATGEEAYSLAMTLFDAGVPARILGTDLNRVALRRATLGRYSGRSLRRVPEDWRSRYFEEEEEDGTFRVSDELRACMSFQLHNVLTSESPPQGWSRFDAVVCRNVLIYFEREQAVEIIQRLARACRPSGYLLLGAIERPLFWMSKLATREQAAELVQLATEQPAPWRSHRDLGSSRHTRPRGSGTAWPAGTPGPAAPSLQPAALLDRADTAEARGRMDEAMAHIDQAIAIAPLWAPAHLARGLVLKRAGRLHEAIDALRASRFLDGHAWLAPYQLALCLDAVGEADDALEAYRHALGVLQTLGTSGLHRPSAEVESLATTAAEVCRDRIGAWEQP